MKTLLISYDLGSPETREDYKELIGHIKGYPLWAKVLYSVWLVKTDKTCSAVRNEIKQKVDSNDKVLVIDVTDKGWATFGIPSKVTGWMKENI